MARSFPFSRRALLAGLPCTGAGMWVPWLARRAEAALPPRRLLIFYTMNSTPYPHWHMRRPGLGDGATWQFDLNPIPEVEMSRTFKPLYEHRKKLLILDSLANLQGSNSGHGKGSVALFTGSRPVVVAGETTPNGSPVYASSTPSLDQVVAKSIQEKDRRRFGSLELAIPYEGIDAGLVHFPSIWQGGKVKMPVTTDPAKLFERLSSAWPVPSAGPMPQTREQKIEGARRRIVELEHPRYKALAAKVGDKLGAFEKERIESHATFMRDLAINLTPVEGGSCGPKPSLSGEGSPMDQKLENFARLVTAAFTCDLTRVASIQVGQPAAVDIGLPKGTNVHNHAGHAGRDPQKQLDASTYYQLHARHFATILKHLDGVKEPNGSTLLDNTIVLWMPESGSWVHWVTHVPAVIAGGAGFKMGRYLHWAGDKPYESDGAEVLPGTARLGPPTTKLLVSVARQMGLSSVNQIGDEATSGKMLPGIDLTGPLPGLLEPLTG